MAAERGWEGNELVTFNQDILVLANPEIAQLPGWVIALIAAGGIAAALSTAAGLLLAISLGHQPRPHQIGDQPPTSRKRASFWRPGSRWRQRSFLATWLGLNPPGFAALVVALAFGLAAATLFPTLMMGIFSKRNERRGVPRQACWQV